MIAMVIRDGNAIRPKAGQKCPSGYYAVRVYISTGHDYHFIRQDPDGTWSDKHGDCAIDPGCVGITDPNGHAGTPKPLVSPRQDPGWTPAYDKYCGQICVKRQNPGVR